jgi:cytochrome P450
MKDPLNFLYEVWQEHGDVVQFPVPFPTYLINSESGVREVLVNHNAKMGKRTVQYSSLALVTGEGLLTAEHEPWKPMRRLLQPAFHHELVNLSTTHVQAALARLDDRWAAAVDSGQPVLDVDAEMMRIALEIVGDALFGTDLTESAEELANATLVALHEVIARSQNPLALPLAIPTPANRRMNKAIARLDRVVEQVIAARSVDLLPDGVPIRDMLDVLLDRDLTTPLSAKQIRDEIITFVVAGHETVASGLVWTWHLLASAPEIADDLAANPALAQQVFDEALRLYPPAWVITRRALAEIEIEGVRIPAGALIITSPWLLHRNPAVWSNPLDFDISRFADGLPARGYLPFGAGPRICIGKEMARLEAREIVAHIASKYRLKPLTTGTVPMEASVTLRPVGGLPMRIERR